ncbi:MAG: hypothetical protein FWE90_02290 [Defluviitaleaceae bacterium]|nr:hypothetical protein [Defluviitaleaceae bacterium]
MRFLSGHKKTCFIYIVLLLSLSACSSASAFNRALDSDALYNEGILIPFNPAEAVTLSYETVTVLRDDLIRQMNIAATPFYPFQSHLYFPHGGGYFSGAFVNAGQRVQEGDVLAILTFPPELLEIERLQLIYQIEYIYNGKNEVLEQQLAMVENKLAGLKIVAPFDGLVTFAHNAAPGTFFSGVPPIFAIANESTVLFFADASPLHIRFGDVLTLQVIGGDPFEARVINDPIVSGNHYTQARFWLAPCDLFIGTSAHGANFYIDLSYAIAENTLVLPQRAVQSDGVGMRHFVQLYENGHTTKRYVIIGAVEGSTAQILSGLDEGQKVALP